MPFGRWIKKSSPGRCTLQNGYVQVRLVNHPLFPGKTYDYEHRVVMAEHLGRRLRKGEEVHHKKAPKTNNRLSNLELKKSRKDHMKDHSGKPCSVATRKKISKSNTGKIRTPEARAKVSKALKGRKRSQEFKDKVSKGMKRFRASQKREKQ